MSVTVSWFYSSAANSNIQFHIGYIRQKQFCFECFFLRFVGMGFYYAREKKEFDAEWEKTAAWYEDIEKNAAVR